VPIVERGKASWFGGPDDHGIKIDEGLALVDRTDFGKGLFKGLFLPTQPDGTTGLARALATDTAHFIACRWNYEQTPKAFLQRTRVVVAANNGRTFADVRPMDWGPNEETHRVADLSRKLMADLGITTDDEVEVTIPLPGELVTAPPSPTSPAVPGPIPTPIPGTDPAPSLAQALNDLFRVVPGDTLTDALNRMFGGHRVPPPRPPSPGIIVPPQPGLIVPPSTVTRVKWPTQAELPGIDGDPDSPRWSAENIVNVPCPWPLLMDGTTLDSIQINRRCAHSLVEVLTAVWDDCGRDYKKVVSEHFNLYSGSYVNRPIRGGHEKSTHAFGRAIDWFDQGNQQHSQHHEFTASTILIKWFLAAGWVWGGTWRSDPLAPPAGEDIDAMHVQSAEVR
jgi:hypothetical protein